MLPVCASRSRETVQGSWARTAAAVHPAAPVVHGWPPAQRSFARPSATSRRGAGVPCGIAVLEPSHPLYGGFIARHFFSFLPARQLPGGLDLG